jgi:anaerobic magnesium-protoporphyrin IX monomethyl ester cyclase
MNRTKNKILLYNAIQINFSDSIPSFSLMALSAYLKEKGYEVELLLNRYSDAELKNALDECLAIGFSLYTGGSHNAFKMASRIRKFAPDIPLVWGGYHPTLEAQQCLKNKYIDYVIRGQGEITFEELLNYFKDPNNHSLLSIKGLSFKENGKIFHNETRESSDINEFPRFDYSLYDRIFKNVSSVNYLASRGCPFSCKFCCSTNFNRNHGMKFYQLPLDRVMSDLEFLVSYYNPTQIDFFDDNFFVSRERILQFIQEYKKRGFKFKWTAFGRCSFFSKADEELMRGLKEIGLRIIFFGVESGSKRILKMINK